MRLIRNILYLLLILAVFTCGGCASKQKATNRYKQETEYEYDNRTKETVQNDLVKDSVSTRKSTTDWSSIINSIDVNPINPDQPAEVEIGENENGNLVIKTNNANVSKKTQQEQKKQTTQDSTGTKEVDKGSKTTDTDQSGSGSNQINTRNSNVESSRWPTWIYFVVILVVLVLAGGLILELRPDSLISNLLNKVLKRKE